MWDYFSWIFLLFLTDNLFVWARVNILLLCTAVCNFIPFCVYDQGRSLRLVNSSVHVVYLCSGSRPFWLFGRSTTWQIMLYQITEVPRVLLFCSFVFVVMTCFSSVSFEDHCVTHNQYFCNYLHRFNSILMPFRILECHHSFLTIYLPVETWVLRHSAVQSHRVLREVMCVRLYVYYQPLRTVRFQCRYGTYSTEPAVKWIP